MNGLISLTNGYGMQRFFDRNRISKLCFSQRLIYEISNIPNDITTHYGFCYRNKMTNTYTTDSGRTVLFAESGIDNAGYLCDSIYENMQHTDLYYFAGNDTTLWYLKPVMRIRQNDYDPNDTTTVVRIDVRNYAGNTIKSLKIRVRNFGSDGVSYDGSYSSIYNFINDLGTNTELLGNFTSNGLNQGYASGGNPDLSKVDFKVYWYGMVDVWFDKMIVDDKIANELFSPDPNINHNSKIQDESQHFGNDIVFSADELVSSSAYTTKYVIDKAREYNSNSKIIVAISNNLNIYSHKNDTLGARMLLNIARPDIVAIDAHPFPLDNYYGVYIPQNLSYADSFDTRILPVWIKSNSIYNKMLQDTALGNKDRIGIPYQGTFLYQIYQVRNDIAQISDYNPKVVIQPQLQGWMKQIDNDFKTEGQREPTNEEIEAQTGMAVAHGADGISWFFYMSYKAGGINTYLLDNPPAPAADTFYNVYGMRNRLNDPIFGSYTKRTRNIYGQNKWDYVKNTNQKVMNWKPVLDKTKWDGGYSVHHEGANHEFISDIQSLYRDAQLDYEEFNTDASNERYWEMGFYENDPMSPNYSSSDKSKYFIMVNRRCAPEVLGGDGDYRGLKIKFDAADLPNFNNWKVIDVNTGSAVVTINKNSNTYYSFDEFKPGEAKMYKIAPVMQEGGTFVCDESFGNVTLNCKGNVNNGGYNLTIADNTVISFDSAKKITLNGGNFTCGGVRESWSEEQIGNDVTLIGSGVNTYWDGLEISNCNIVSIGGTKFERVRGNSLYAINAYNCNTFRIRYNLFLSGSQNQQTGSVSYNFIPMEEVPAIPLIEITGNRIYHNNSNLPSVQVTNYSSGQTSVLVRNNEFYGYSSAVGLFLNNVTGGSVKSNSITNYVDAIVLATSYIDLFKNTINNNSEASKSLSINFGSVANMNFNSNIVYQNSGVNVFINTYSGSRNIFTDNSYFTTKGGFNTFDVTNGEIHFYGTFDDYYNGGKEDAEYNCFRIDGDDNIDYTDIDWYSGGDVTFNPSPYVCTRPSEDEFDTVVYAEDIVDTLWSFSGGLGGGYSNKQKNSHITSEPSIFEIKTDSLNYYLRKRRFNEIKRIGNELTNSFSDSDRVIDIIQPLYFATMVTDNENHNGISALKTKLEDLIANNSENDALILRCNYFIQKCKVILEEYSSALSGFYDLMQAYPYSWEGVVAGWDYSATQLISQSGQGGGLIMKGEKLEVKSKKLETSEIVGAKRAELPYEPAGEFTNEPYGDDPKGVRKTVEKTLTDVKEKTEKQIKIEEQQVKELKIDVKNEKNIKQSKALEKKLQQKKVMSEVIKPRKPETVIEHINFVNSDIQKIYSINNKTTDVEDNVSLPEKYSLSQNYPNPFNPVTKIKFELPQESKVIIEIYDILGRKVAQLINNELRQPGRYEVQFNGHNFASGTYFYRLVASDFIQTKRMMLIK